MICIAMQLQTQAHFLLCAEGKDLVILAFQTIDFRQHQITKQGISFVSYLSVRQRPNVTFSCFTSTYMRELLTL